MQRFIAINNVCAWPNLTLMPDGSITAAIFNQPCHGTWEGDVDVWGSEDGGKLWSKRGTASPHDPTTNRMNVAAGLANNGDLIVIASGWSKRLPVGQNSPQGEVIQAWVSRSADGGRTWSITKSFPPACEPDMCELIPFGDVLRSGDGSLGVSAYAAKKSDMGGYGSTYFLRSRDDGKTWGECVVLGPGNFNETAPFHLGNGKWIAAARTVQPQDVHLFASDDDGKTWSHRGPVTLPSQHPADIIRLKSNHLLLTYGNRCNRDWSINTRISGDEGKTWSAPTRLVEIGSSDLGYPSTVQLADGSLCTAYYSSGTATHNRYHMATVLWKLDEAHAV